jgi:hypothetical protein
MNSSVRFFGLALGLLACATISVPVVSASVVYDTNTNIELIGSRTEGDNPGIFAVGDWLGSGGSISWEIIDLGGGNWSYDYLFEGFESPVISHFILDLTDDCVDPGDAGCVVTTVNIELGAFEGTGTDLPNPFMPAGIIGVKFDDGGNFFSFTSNRNPVWGNFYIKAGSPLGQSFGAAWNTGLGNELTSENILDFIPRPNGGGGPPIPEPSTLLLMGGGLTALGWWRRRRMSAR